MKVAVIFNGQGAHYEGMGLDFVEAYPQARETFNLAEAVTGLDIRGLVSENFEQLQETRYAQVAIATTSLAIYNSIASMLPEVSYMAGLSLGEYTALLASGSIDTKAGIQLIQHRGNIMGDHCTELAKGEPFQMAAVMKLPLDVIRQIVSEVHQADTPLYIANMNADHQTIIAGSQASLDRFAEAAKAEGLKRLLPLSVEGPFHTPLMQACCMPFRKVLENVAFAEGQTPVISNTTVQAHDADSFRENLVRHLVEPVHWVQTIAYLQAAGVTHVLQIGPGDTLSRLLKRDKVPLDHYVIDKVEDIEGLAAFLKED